MAMPSLEDSAPAILPTLAEHFGSPDLTPTGDPIRAFLERSIESRKVQALLDAWRDAGVLEPAVLAATDASVLVNLARDAGVTPSPKVLGPLRRLADWLARRGDAIEEASTETLRDELLALNGIGSATADAVLRDGLGRAVFPVDRASYRIFVRHEWVDPWAEYDDARLALQRLAPDDALNLARLSAWFERVGRDYCRPSVAKCDGCPLRLFLPAGGPLLSD